MATCSSLCVNLGGRFDRTMPLPLRPHVSPALYESFANEMDAICRSTRQQEQYWATVWRVGAVAVDCALVVLTAWLSLMSLLSLNGLTLLLAVLVYTARRLIGACLSDYSVFGQSSVVDSAQQVCEDYSRRFGTVTVHYRENVLLHTTGRGRCRSSCVEFHYPIIVDATAAADNDLPIEAEMVVVLPAPSEAELLRRRR